MNTGPRLRLEGVTRRFPGVVANDDVNLAVEAGEIHALLGENGAGKSTLVKFIYGVQSADSGTLFWEGVPRRIANPKAARRLGIAMVFQHFSLFDAMTVAENIALGLPRSFARSRLEECIHDVSRRYGLPLDPGRHVHALSVGERQRIEVVRCLLQEPRLLIMDEPTSVLTPQEVESLFATLRRLSEDGVSILYISHKLQEIRDLCHKATIMRGGRVVAECDPATRSTHELAELMIGSDLTLPRRTSLAGTAEPRLEVRHLDLASSRLHGTPLNDISFEVLAGEVLGIAGIAGNGQQELMDALSGETPLADDHTILADGRPVGASGPNRRRAAGMVFVPEERLGHGAVPQMTLWENALLSGVTTSKLVHRGMIRSARARAFAATVVKDFDVRTPGVMQPASSLSGGNLQKFIIGREISHNPGIIVALQPTWGVDAGSAAAVRQALIDLAADGAAVLVISQDLEELMEISDRLCVISQGRLSPPMRTMDATASRIGLLMAGS